MRKLACPLALLTLAIVAPQARSQPAAAEERDALAEVRLLRQAVERQTAMTVRGQLLMTRLIVQYQRVSRAQNAVDRTAEAADTAERRRDQARESVETAQRVFLNVVDEPRRTEMERQLEGLRAKLTEQERELSRLRVRRQQIEQGLQGEERAYEKLETALGALDQQLQRPTP
jgi:chromosome segregation ATPase